MGTITSFHRTRLSVEVNIVPAGFPRSLERRGLARRVKVVEGVLEMEPLVSGSVVLAACKAAGLTVLGFSSTAPRGAGWQASARPSARCTARLTNRRSSVWLPTFPAA